MLKITRRTNAGTTTLIVSGRIDAEQLPDLRRSVETEHASDVVLDLNEVSLVDVEVVRFLLHCEMQGIRLAHCPAYVREWMAREKRPP
jgi:anti-anti-sigma regulatory factor